IPRRALVGGGQRRGRRNLRLHPADPSAIPIMTLHPPLVLIVDDDPRVREALGELLEAHGLRVAAYASAGEYACAAPPEGPACLLLDVELPDINGLDLQSQLADA